MEKHSQLVETSTASENPNGKRPYIAPRVERKIPVRSNTLLSGGQCTLPGEPCPPGF